jgi:hypothetical protein
METDHSVGTTAWSSRMGLSGATARSASSEFHMLLNHVALLSAASTRGRTELQCTPSQDRFSRRCFEVRENNRSASKRPLVVSHCGRIHCSITHVSIRQASRLIPTSSTGFRSLQATFFMRDFGRSTLLRALYSSHFSLTETKH